MNDTSICKTCIWFDDLACRNNQKICIDNSEYLDAADVIRNICAEEDNEEEGDQENGDQENENNK